VTGSIRTLFWDIGGVVLTNGWDIDQRTKVLSRLGVDLEAYEEVHERANYYWERGLITAKEFFAQTVLNPNPKLDLTFDIVWKQVCAQSKVLHPECLDILAELKRQGRYRLATLNNESRELNGHRLDAFKLRSLFDYFICSGYVHEMKPLPGVYRSAIDISGFEARTALFIDDKEENCESAKVLGMQTIWFKNPEQLCTALADYDIHVNALEQA
jgi:HAD superfamily hydrolase (TIGR01509 family)